MNEFKRMVIKVSDVTTEVATIPTTNDHTDGSWLATDIYVGELFLNITDDVLQTRTDAGIITLNSGGGGGSVTGTGTTNYVSKWTGATTQGDSLIFDDGTSVSIGASLSASNLSGTNTGDQVLSDFPLDTTNLVVVPESNIQDYAEGVDHSLLKARGSGVSTTYVSTVVVGGTTFSQPAVSGEIHSDQGYFDINYTGATNITVTNLNVASVYVYIDNAGVLQQQTSIPTRQDWSRKMFTMRIAIDLSNNTIIGFEYLNNPIGHYANSIRDVYTYLLAQGVPFKKDQVVTGRATDLGFDVSAGSIMEFGGTGDIDNANIITLNAVSNATFFLATRTSFDSGTNTDLPKFWDNNGVITALGSTTLVGHRLYRFSNGNLVMQYGQGNYANMTLAKAGVVLEDYVLNPILKNATFFGWWFVESTATNTGGTTLTDFVEYTIGLQGGSSSGLSGCLLKGNNLSDLLDVTTARTNLNLGNVDNTSDSDKPISTDQQTALDNTTLIPTLTVGTDRSLVLTDRNKNIENDNSITITVPLNSSVAFTIGTQIFFTKKFETLTIAGAVGVTVNSVDSLLELGRLNCGASLLKVDTDEWNLIGELV